VPRRVAKRFAQRTYRLVDLVRRSEIVPAGCRTRRKDVRGVMRLAEAFGRRGSPRVERTEHHEFDQRGVWRKSGLNTLDRDRPRRGAEFRTVLADLGLQPLLAVRKRFQLLLMLGERRTARPVQGQSRKLRGDIGKLHEQFAIGGIGGVLTQRRQRVGHRIQHPSLPLQEDQRRQCRRVRVAGRQVHAEGNRSIGAVGEAFRKRELLPFGSDGQIHRELIFNRGVDAMLIRERLRDVADRRVGPGKVAERRERSAAIGTARLFPNLKRAAVRLDGVSVIALRRVDIPEIREVRRNVRMIRADRLQPDLERAPVVLLGGGVVAPLPRDDAEILQRVGDPVGVRPEQPLSNRQRSVKKLVCPVVIVAIQIDHPQIVQQIGEQDALGQPGALGDCDRAPFELLRLVVVAGVLAKVGERHETARHLRVIGPQRSFGRVERVL
jgi:hypothetical protein